MSKYRKKVAEKIILSSIILCLIGVLFIINNYQSGTVISSEEDFFSVKIIATENYGDTTIFSEEVTVTKGESAMDALEKVSDITNTYGGGFVESINTITSEHSEENKEKKDWFYYINGMLASIGASQYTLHPGDVERWDFHDWGSDRMTTAIIGDYPEPFLHGFRGEVRKTTVVYSDKFSDNAYALQQSLKELGVSVSVKLFEELTITEKSSNNLILIDIYNNNLITELNNNVDTLGFFIEFDDNNVITYDGNGKEDHFFDSGGVILATQNPWNPKGNWNGENVVWIITGITNEDVNAAVDVLVNNHNGMQNCASLIIVDGNLYKVP